jgi:hypothetical protein
VCLRFLVLLVSSWYVWSCFVRFCVGFSFRAGCVFGSVLVPEPREVTEPLWNTCCAAIVATGLTGSVHRSDRCSIGSKTCKFQLCVLVCFGSGGCMLVPRSSSTLEAAWAWPTWVVSRRRLVGSRVHLVGVSISFEKNFYWLPFTPSSGIRAGYGS